MASRLGKTAWRRKNKTAGLCPDCKSDDLDGRIYCRKCRAQKGRLAARAYQRYVAQGLCPSCRKTTSEIGLLCLPCWFRQMANAATKTPVNGKAVRELLDQQGSRCAYTGELLVPGQNASLDHKIPRSRGGLNVIGNLHWVTIRVNFMKRDLIHDEFLLVCRAVAAQTGAV